MTGSFGKPPAPVGNVPLADYSVKPPDTVDGFGVQFQFVSQKNGDDTYDGLSWGSPKATIEAAVAATPHGAIVSVAPGTYTPTSTITTNGHQIVGSIGAGGTNAVATIQHGFNGDLFLVSKGGRFQDVYLSSTGTFTGAAIHSVSTTAVRAGSLYLTRVTVSGTNGFERDLYLDGSADSTVGGPGLRQVFVTDCQFFGCRTAGETVLLNKVIHARFSGCMVIQAPENSTTQGVKILTAESDDIMWSGGYILGDFYTESQGLSVQYQGHITGNVTFAAASNSAKVLGTVGGTVTNNGGSANEWMTGPVPSGGVRRTTDQSVPNGSQTTITWNLEVWDTGAMVDVAGAATKCATIVTPGRYVFTANVAFATNAAGLRSLFLLKNGGIIAAQRGPAVTGVETMMSASTTLDLAAADFLQVAVLQDSGGALNVNGTSGPYGASAAVSRA